MPQSLILPAAPNVRTDQGELVNVPAALADQIKAALDASPQL
jgi:hypothetical protein